jgi:hypothetical protein
VNPFSKEELLQYLDGATASMKEQFDDAMMTKADHDAADRLLQAFAEIRRRIEVGP